MPPERVLRFLLTHVASFRGLSPAPSHHLGVDVFVGTWGTSDVAATSGVVTTMRPSSAVGPDLRVRPARTSAAGSSRGLIRFFDRAPPGLGRVRCASPADGEPLSVQLVGTTAAANYTNTARGARSRRAHQADSARTTPLSRWRLSVLLERWTNLRRTSGYVLPLGCLVNARRSLYQSKPSIEDTNATTAGGRMQAEFPVSVGAWLDPSRLARRRPVPGRRQRIRRRRARSDVVPVRATYLSLRIVELRTPRQVVRNPCNTRRI